MQKDTDKNSSQELVAKSKKPIQIVYGIVIALLLLYIIFAGSGLLIKLIISIVVLVVVTLVMAVLVKLQVWPFK